ncbi:hypothetical protein PTE30175_00108 [Pandoraea terrae]|uniref:RES domain-containing protein n=1 Tax=Pandoraea terrae TaxID=1537710 RepID=A0A5E4RDF5_9BURK|nr:RES family NAD+ phosphorylase [Pandoraea terrae]VVD61215.1 hypothetical protein PTE30175_00108 [Pandoraea terrae]
MPTGEDDVLHRVQCGILRPGDYWHVFPAVYSPTASNPNSKARLAWRDGFHSMFYAGDTPAAALWETALRNAGVRQGYVYTDPVHLKGMSLARLSLTVEVPLLDLRTPYRRELVDANSALDAMWDHALKRSDYEATHDITQQLMAQLMAAGYPDGAALRWHSRQAGSDSAFLFFEPPMTSAWWTYEDSDIFPLDELSGQEQIRQALAHQGLTWRGAPGGTEFEPDLHECK